MYQLENYVHWGQDVASTQEGQNSSVWQEVSSAVADEGLDPCSCPPCDSHDPGECPSTLVIQRAIFHNI